MRSFVTLMSIWCLLFRIMSIWCLLFRIMSFWCLVLPYVILLRFVPLNVIHLYWSALCHSAFFCSTLCHSAAIFCFCFTSICCFLFWFMSFCAFCSALCHSGVFYPINVILLAEFFCLLLVLMSVDQLNENPTECHASRSFTEFCNDRCLSVELCSAKCHPGEGHFIMLNDILLQVILLISSKSKSHESK